MAGEPGIHHWVIPVESGGELLEADLEDVAGGMTGVGQFGGLADSEPPQIAMRGGIKRTGPDTVDPAGL